MHVPQELKIKYLDRRIMDIQLLRSSLSKGDFALALKLGHQVKGNAATFEFPQMAQLGCEIEMAAKCHDRIAIENLVKKMESEIKEAQAQILN